MRRDKSWNKDGVLGEQRGKIYWAIKFKSFYNYTKITLAKINVGTKGLCIIKITFPSSMKTGNNLFTAFSSWNARIFVLGNKSRSPDMRHVGLTVKYCFCADEFIIVLMNSFGLNLKLLIWLVTKETNFFQQDCALDDWFSWRIF